MTPSISPASEHVPSGHGPDFDLDRVVSTRYFDAVHSYCHPKAGIVPGAGKDGRPAVVMLLNTLRLSGSDIFEKNLVQRTDDLGETWTEPREIANWSPKMTTIAGESRWLVGATLWPQWHPPTQTLLATGLTVVYTPQWRVAEPRPQDSVYAVYDAERGRWRDWQALRIPDAKKFERNAAGCSQRVDLADGTILLPLHFRPSGHRRAMVAVIGCVFDGNDLTYLSHGNDIAFDDDTRGLFEPSLTCFDGVYLLTIRHDECGFVTRSRDGLHYEPIRRWTFDDGTDLGNYNTQTHWVTHSDGLYLTYTRRGANNDHVFRHRAPLFMARVDPERLCVVRDTERVLVPERGARLGNFAVTDVSPHETWVTVAEWMQPSGCERYGSDGSVFVARIHWNRPNRLFPGSARDDTGVGEQTG